jgi:hypothetical protein
VGGLLFWNVTLQQEANKQERYLLQHREVINALVAGGQVFHVPGTDAAPQAAGVLVQKPSSERSVLIVAGLPRLPSEMGYQVWLIQDESTVPLGAGTLSVIGSDVYGVAISATFNITGTDAQPVIVSDTFSGADGIGVSVEPAEGSTTPTGDIVLLGEL